METDKKDNTDDNDKKILKRDLKEVNEFDFDPEFVEFCFVEYDDEEEEICGKEGEDSNEEEAKKGSNNEGNDKLSDNFFFIYKRPGQE